MKNKRKYTIAVVASITLLFFSATGAFGSSRAIDLEPTKHHPEASGSAMIGNGQISVEARGLKPDSVYTVWFVNTSPKKHETGAGEAPYMFRTDKSGEGTYRAPLDESPFGRWAMVMIVLHPNGNPEDMKSMVGTLKAKI